jgi:hypothetical protein
MGCRRVCSVTAYHQGKAHALVQCEALAAAKHFAVPLLPSNGLAAYRPNQVSSAWRDVAAKLFLIAVHALGM